MDSFKIIIFVLHFFFFGLTGVFFLLKIRGKDNIKPVMVVTGVLWIVFGFIDFILELSNVISTLV
jgi:hypothetical protein